MDERVRHERYEDMKRVMGERSADALMRYLPPVGWGDIATRRDLDLLEARMEARVEALRADVSEQLRAQTVTLVATFVSAVTVVNAVTGGVIVAILKLT